MPYINCIVLLLVIVLSSFTAKNFKINGYLNDVSPNEEWILYSESEDFDSGELHMASLQALYVPTGKVIKLTRIFMEYPSTFFLNDSMVAIPFESDIDIYNLDTKKFEKKPLLTYDKNYQLWQFSLNEDRTKAALLFRDYKNYIDGPGEDKSQHRVELKIVDLKSHKEYVVDQYSYSYSPGESYDIKNILWHGDQLVYSFQNQLYYYQLGNPKRIFITDSVYNYAIDKDELIYATIGKNSQNDCLKSFSFTGLTSTKLKLEGYVASAETVHIDKLSHVMLVKLEDESYHMRDSAGKFVKIDDKYKLFKTRLLYKTKHLTIEQDSESVKVSEEEYITMPRLIIKSY